jgi:hypothetical protein
MGTYQEAEIGTTYEYKILIKTSTKWVSRKYPFIIKTFCGKTTNMPTTWNSSSKVFGCQIGKFFFF